MKEFMDNDTWNTGIEYSIIRPIAKKAIDKYADDVIENRTGNYEIDGYSIRMHRNLILYEDIYAFIEPRAKDAQYMINVEVGIPKGQNMRWFVGIFYKFEDHGWVEESKLKELTTYETSR